MNALASETPNPDNAEGTSSVEWQRLSSRIIWVDLAQTVLSIAPIVIALLVFRLEFGANQLWPLVGIAIFGVFAAVADAVRWLVTSYRVTDTHVEGRTGLFTRVTRSIRRDRIRSVDIEAKLRHRITGLRVVKIGAGQQAAAGESALSMDALRSADAKQLQGLLLNPDTQERIASELEDDATASEPIRSFAHFKPSWVIYNVFNFWAYVLVLGLAWGAYWLLTTFGIDLLEIAFTLLDWDSFGWFGSSLIVLAAATVFGVLALGFVYFAEYWNFELSRHHGPEGTMLRTRQGLFTTREVNRDENRIRGIDINEPLLWRWLRVSDTSVITTGLDMNAMSQPAAILPRGPLPHTKRIASEVLGSNEEPLSAPLNRHPRRAFLHRACWATTFSVIVAAVLLTFIVTNLIGAEWLWVAAGCWIIGLVGAFIHYRALGHTILGKYLVTRSGVLNRSTSVLQRDAVSTIVIRESLLQRRLRLQSVGAMTAAGYGGYDTPDLDANTAVTFAAAAAPGILEPFLVFDPDES
ncbi:MAG: PH domain-containing protein [Gulosibacter sp.]|uniref:PH domain-containing protein n=1 Tax=Gulosibacter sp. TaxID=2817531 RepID=UPI003F91AD4C